MRILMTAGALQKVEACVLDDSGVRGRRTMALGAVHLFVTSRECELGSRVIEGDQRFPARITVALLAVSAELPRVPIVVTRQAGGPEPKETPARVFNRDQLAGFFGNMTRAVALYATQSRMTAFEPIPGGAVIEIVFRCGPPDDAELLAVVLGVTAGAVDITFSPVDNVGMIAMFGIHQLADITMASQASQFGGSRPENMATGAFQRSFQRTVGS
jgi:hypothetical protein